ncbi:MAG: hypothetical protein ACI9IA_000673 [Enterobacterales bacterium]|jgi:hypothetical protein
MTILIFAFATFMIIVGFIIIISPLTIFNLLIKNSKTLWLYAIAILARLLLGTLLVYQASISKFPHAVDLLGWVIIVSAIVFIVIGRKKFIQLISWATRLLNTFGRISGVLAVSFGAFLIYAFI